MFLFAVSIFFILYNGFSISIDPLNRDLKHTLQVGVSQITFIVIILFGIILFIGWFVLIWR